MRLVELLDALDYTAFPQYYLKTDQEHSPDLAPLLQQETTLSSIISCSIARTTRMSKKTDSKIDSRGGRQQSIQRDRCGLPPGF